MCEDHTDLCVIGVGGVALSEQATLHHDPEAVQVELDENENRRLSQLSATAKVGQAPSEVCTVTHATMYRDHHVP
jgi:hypothetical protein